MNAAAVTVAEHLLAAFARIPGVTKCFVRTLPEKRYRAALSVPDIEPAIYEHLRLAIVQVAGETGQSVELEIEITRDDELDVDDHLRWLETGDGESFWPPMKLEGLGDDYEPPTHLVDIDFSAHEKKP